MIRYDLRDFLSRSTDRAFEDTTLSQLLDNLPPLSPEGPWLAGGALRRTIRGQEPDSDFDFFFRDADQLTAFADALKAAGLREVRTTEHHVHYKGVVGSGPERDIQLIRFMFYPNVEAVIDSFDFTICQIGFDGEALAVGDFTLWDLARQRLAIHKITFPVSTMRRVLKYAKQGFNACNGALATLLTATADNPELRTDIAYVD